MTIAGSEAASKLARKIASRAALLATYCPPTAAEARTAGMSGDTSRERNEEFMAEEVDPTMLTGTLSLRDFPRPGGA
jgi:hypothetical protein